MTRVYVEWRRLGDSDDVESWTIETATDVATELVRRKKPFAVRISDDVLAAGLAFARPEVLATLGELAPDERKLLVRRFAFDATVEDSAAALAVPARDARRRSRRLARRLQDRLSRVER